MRLGCLIALVGLSVQGATVAAPNPFFAMDNIARGTPAEVTSLLRDNGYDGYGGRPFDPAMPKAIFAAGLKYYTGYVVLTLVPGEPAVDPKLDEWLELVAWHDVTLWVAINTVKRADGGTFAVSDPAADSFVVERLRALAIACERRAVKVSLYPHAGFWMEHLPMRCVWWTAWAGLT